MKYRFIIYPVVIVLAAAAAATDQVLRHIRRIERRTVRTAVNR